MMSVRAVGGTGRGFSKRKVGSLDETRVPSEVHPSQKSSKKRGDEAVAHSIFLAIHDYSRDAHFVQNDSFSDCS